MVSSSVSATITEFGCNYFNYVPLFSSRNYAHIWHTRAKMVTGSSTDDYLKVSPLSLSKWSSCFTAYTDCLAFFLLYSEMHEWYNL